MIEILYIAAGYLMGSIPFGLIITRLAGLGDLRKIGSGNIGATNAARVGGLKMFVLVTILDALKAAAAFHLFGMYAGAAAVAGHCYPAWLKFKGGKGVASSAGFLGILNPAVLGACLAAFCVSLAITKYSSLSAFAAMPVAIAGAFYTGLQAGWVTTGLAVMILWRERGNIKRLFDGTESKMNFKQK
ncbi:MAG: glycerol-3-phosphate 1-O-acyltransferase PlsY [Rickettsiales bacterium]|nr:glycerol-3-phosphate 1-O-acyltransferase PlsY [Rickettsiales bacterium]